MRLPPALGLLFALIAFPVLADIAPEPLAGLSELHPMDAEAAQGISMKREEVVIELHDAYALIDATFTMLNPGPARELQVGFPGHGVHVANESTPIAHRPLEGFSAWVKEQPVSSEARDIERTGYWKPLHETWHVFTAHFASGETLIRVRYGVVSDPYDGVSMHTGERINGRRVWYILATGGRWAGPIGKIFIRLKARDGVKAESIRVRTRNKETAWKTARDGATAPSADATRDAEGITLRRNNLEATENDNLQIVYTPDASRVPRGASEEDTRPANRLLRKALGLEEAKEP